MSGKKLSFAENFGLSGCAAIVSKTAAAPIERVKLLIQNQVTCPNITKLAKNSIFLHISPEIAGAGLRRYLSRTYSIRIHLDEKRGYNLSYKYARYVPLELTLKVKISTKPL